jgi:hypothetical protein
VAESHARKKAADAALMLTWQKAMPGRKPLMQHSRQCTVMRCAVVCCGVMWNDEV